MRIFLELARVAKACRLNSSTVTRFKATETWRLILQIRFMMWNPRFDISQMARWSRTIRNLIVISIVFSISIGGIV